MNNVTYICNYILTYYENVKEFSNSDFILSLAKSITKDIPNVDFANGNYDFYIDNFIYRIMENRNSVSFSNYSNVKNHIFLVVNYYKIVNNLQIDNMDVIVKSITNEVMSTNSYEDIINGNIDEYIESLVNTIQIPSIKEDKIDTNTKPIFDYIVNFLNKNSNAYCYDGDVLTIAKDIMDDALSKNIDKSIILSGKYDKEIYLIIVGSKFNLKPSNSLVGVVDYVRSLVNKYNKYMNLDNKEKLMLDNALDISFKLVSRVYNVMDIYDGNYDDYIINEIKKSSMKKNSLVTDSVESYGINPNSFKSNNRKINGKAVAAAVLSATILFMAKNNMDSDIKFDNYSYETIENEHDDEFADTLKHIEEQFSKNESAFLGSGQLCFKNAYDSVSCEKFHAMDTMFFLIKQSNVYEKSDIGNEVDSYTCYARYVYDKLVKNGYDLPSKYLDAVSNYDRQVANYKLLNPYYTIDKKDRSTLNSMMKIYTEYCNGLEDSLNKTMEGKNL